MTFDILEWLVRRDEQQQARIEALSTEILKANNQMNNHGSQIKSLLTRMASVEKTMKSWRAYAGKAYFIVIPVILMLVNADPETVAKTILQLVAVVL